TINGICISRLIARAAASSASAAPAPGRSCRQYGRPAALTRSSSPPTASGSGSARSAQTPLSVGTPTPLTPAIAPPSPSTQAPGRAPVGARPAAASAPAPTPASPATAARYRPPPPSSIPPPGPPGDPPGSPRQLTTSIRPHDNRNSNPDHHRTPSAAPALASRPDLRHVSAFGCPSPRSAPLSPPSPS